jgi:hypothetical protein
MNPWMYEEIERPTPSQVFYRRWLAFDKPPKPLNLLHEPPIFSGAVSSSPCVVQIRFMSHPSLPLPRSTTNNLTVTPSDMISSLISSSAAFSIPQRLLESSQALQM